MPVFRLDADTAGTKDAVPRLLARFDAAPAGLLLGTQMVAKGHDFPDVTLGVVLDADSTLRFPDFRAEERTFALIAQLAGRAGPRAARRARARADDRAGRAGDRWRPRGTTPTGFVAGELARREALRYPPFADLIRVVCLAEDGARGARGGRPGGATRVAVAGHRRARARRRCSACAAASASSSWSRRPSAAAAIAAVARAVEGAARDRALRHVAFSVDVDPQ